MLASEVMDVAAALLNDIDKLEYSYTKQLPYLKIAITKLIGESENHEVSLLKEESAALTVTAGTTVLNSTSTPALPSDFIDPIKLEERAAGSSDLFIEMLGPKEWEPEREIREELIDWAYRENEIKFVGASTDREVKISYYKTIVITSEVSIIPDATLLNVLGFLTAAYCARYIGENYQRYNDLMRDYGDAFDTWIAVQVKRNQAYPKRRRGYRERS